MTTPILFLLGAVALSALGGLVVWIASRPRPERFGSTIDSFSRDLDALAPPGAQMKQKNKPATRVPSASAPRQTQVPSTELRPRPGPRPQAKSPSSSEQGQN